MGAVLEGLEERRLFGGDLHQPIVCKTCPQADVSGAPVGYASGVPLVTSTDLSSNAFGTPFTQTRVWTGVNDAGQNGNGWTVGNLGFLAVKRNQLPGTGGHSGILTVVVNGGAAVDFDVPVNSNTFTAKYGALERLDYVPPTTSGTTNVPGEFHFTDTKGNVTVFNDVPRDFAGGQMTLADGSKSYRLYSGYELAQGVSQDWWNPAGGSTVIPTGSTTPKYRLGAFKSYTDASGKLAVTATYDSDGNLDAVTRTDGTGAFERFDYTVSRLQNNANGDGTVGNSGDASDYLVTGVAMLRGTGSGYTAPTSWTTVRSVDYDYYFGTTSGLITAPGATSPASVTTSAATNKYGRFGDLEHVTIKDPSGTPIEEKYYRYNRASGYQYAGAGSSPAPGYADNIGVRSNPALSGGEDKTFVVGTAGTFAHDDNIVSSALKSVFEGEGFARLAADKGSLATIAALADSNVNPYAQFVFKYQRVDQGDASYPDPLGSSDTRYRVSQEIAAAQGCSMCSAGFGVYRFDYVRTGGSVDTNSSDSRPNVAAMRTTEYLSDATNPLLKTTGATLAYSGGTVTVTWTGHGFRPGEEVQIAGTGTSPFYGTFEIESNSSFNANQFTFSLTTTGSVPTGVTITNLDRVDPAAWADNDQNVVYTNQEGKTVLKAVREVAATSQITSSTYDSGLGVQVFTTSLAHNLLVGDIVEITNAAGDMDRCEVAATPSATTFTVAFATLSATPTPTNPYVAAVRLTATYHRFDAAGREIWTAQPSAVSGFDEGYSDLVNVSSSATSATYLRSDSGRIDITEYGTGPSSALNAGNDPDGSGDVTGYVKATWVSRGVPNTADLSGSSNVTLLTSRTYYQMTVGTGDAAKSVYPLATMTSYFNYDGVAGDDASTTEYTYTRYEVSSIPTNRIASMTVHMPDVATGRHGKGSLSTAHATATSVYDEVGRPIWYRDADGAITYTEYDPKGGVKKRIVDVDTDATSSFSGLPTGWSSPDGKQLITSMALDGLGRTVTVTDPKGNVTWTVYNDAAHGIRVYPGWNATTGTTTGPTQVSREDWGLRYSESFTMSTSPAKSGSSGSYVPTGTESPSNIQSLVRQLNNDAGQIVETDRYFSLSGTSYSAATVRLGSSSDDSASGNYHVTLSDYDGRGRFKRSVTSAGTVTRYIYDARGNLLQTWVGTDDTPTSSSDFWTPAYQAAHSDVNLKLVETRAYDANGNPIALTKKPNDGTADRVTRMYYDYRGRLVAMKSGDQGASGEGTGVQRQLTYSTYDNADHVTSTNVYDADGLTVTWTDGVPNEPSSGLSARTTMAYDERGRQYQSIQWYVDPSTGDVDDDKTLTTGLWYDDRNHVIKQVTPGAASTKNVYDGVGRLTRTYTTDATGDADSGSSIYTDATNVTGDAVLEQTEYTYDSNGNVILTLRRQRFHSETGTGELGGPTSSGAVKARVYYTGSYYDALNRLTRTINVGTNNGSSYTASADLTLTTNWSTDATVGHTDNHKLVTDYAYDTAGRLWRTINPRNIKFQTYYDLLCRKTETIDAAKASGTAYPVTKGNNRTTTYTYSGAGNVLSLKAILPDGDDSDAVDGYQETKYVYGVVPSTGSAIYSNELLAEVDYPAKNAPTTGNADAFAADSTSAEHYAYNALGERTGYIDRRGVVHAYDRDLVGRSTADRVTTFGSGVSDIDQTVTQILTDYDSAGRKLSITSKDATTVKSKVQYAYNGFGQVVAEYQAHDSTAISSSTPKTLYAYAEGTDNSSRLVSMTYPNGRVITYEYASGLNADISRLSALKENVAMTPVTLEAYSYLGLGTYAILDRPAANSRLTYDSGNDTTFGDAGDRYTGLDRFGRIFDQKWQTDDTTPVLLDETRYDYDRNGNRIKADVDPTGAFGTLGPPTTGGNPADRIWGYDDLDRLVEERQGTITEPTTNNPWYIATPKVLVGWVLDTLGNITGYGTITDPIGGDVNLDGAVDFQDTLKIAQNYGQEHGLWADADFDGSGVVDYADLLVFGQNYQNVEDGPIQHVAYEMTTQERTYDGQNELLTMDDTHLSYDANGSQTLGQPGGNTTKYDAWNRPTLVKNSIGTTLTAYAYDGLGRRIVEGYSTNARQDYYNVNWQLIEERASLTATTAMGQYVWSPVYIDALVERDRDADGNTSTGGGTGLTGMEERVFGQWDANFNVTSIVVKDTDAGTTGDQTAAVERYRYAANGERTVLEASGWTPDTLAGSDGTTSDDSLAGWNTSDVLFDVGHQGGRYDRVIAGDMRFRNRTLDVGLERWTQIDPLEYVDGFNLYGYLRQRTLSLRDPLGSGTTGRLIGMMVGGLGGGIGGFVAGGAAGGVVGIPTGPGEVVAIPVGALAGAGAGVVGGVAVGGNAGDKLGDSVSDAVSDVIDTIGKAITGGDDEPLLPIDDGPPYTDENNPFRKGPPIPRDPEDKPCPNNDSGDDGGGDSGGDWDGGDGDSDGPGRFYFPDDPFFPDDPGRFFDPSSN